MGLKIIESHAVEPKITNPYHHIICVTTFLLCACSHPPPQKKIIIIRMKKDSKDESKAGLGESFTISGPSKQRSGGKKKMKSKLQKCSVA